MNTLVKKEIRLLLPSWVVALVLAFSARLIADHQSSVSYFRVYILMLLPFLLAPAMVVMLALDSFGRELSAGTFSSLLAQPVSRTRVWWTKTLLLAAVIFSVWAAWWFSVSTNPKLVMDAQQRHEVFTATLLVALAVYSGGLWTVMLLRQVASAFWFTLLIPAFFAGLTAHFTGKYGSEDAILRNIVVVLTLYSLAGFFWAQRMFLRAEDAAWTGGNINLPGWLKLPGRATPVETLCGHRPRLALITKEFQLHQSTFVIAGVLAVLHVAILFARKFGGEFKDSPFMETFTSVFWFLWPVLPLMIGCVAVAEERKLGTLEAQLCLPVRRWTQFVVKFGVALVLAIAFGVVAPVLFEGSRILPDFHPILEALRNSPSNYPAETQINGFLADLLLGLGPLLPLLPLLLVAVSFVCIAFYASSLTRNTLQAIAPAIVGILIAWTCIMGARFIEDVVHYPLWRGPVIYFLGLPVLTAAVAGLTYWNYKRVLVGWPVWRRNLAVLLLTFAFVTTATTAIYQRAWELVGPIEPAHGPAQLTANGVVGMKAEGLRTSVEFADGRVWSTRFFLRPGNYYAAMLYNWDVKEVAGGAFLAGSNWSSVAHCARDVMALQRDGSLWVSETPDDYRQIWRSGQPPKAEATKLIRYGTNTDWKQLVGRWTVALALKNDGTLWSIGTNRFDWKRTWPGLRSFAPERLGTDNDWAEISYPNDRLLLVKRNGNVYVHPATSAKPVEPLALSADLVAERAPHLDKGRWRSLILTTSRRYGSFQVGVAGDGTFRLASDYQQRAGQIVLTEQNVQLGAETNWVTAVSGLIDQVVTLRSDGTLWVWDFPEPPATRPDTARASQLGAHSDWLAVTATADGIVSLAADGSLWFWRFLELYPSQEFQPLVRPSRKPQLIGNIFAKAE